MMFLRQQGFTLLELLITMMIMVAVLGVAIPQFSRSMTLLQLRKSTQEIAAVLRQARVTSISQSKTAEMTLYIEDHILRSSDSALSYKWPSDIEVEMANREAFAITDEETIRFYPDGTASASRLEISALERSYTIAVDWMTGRVKVL